MGVKGCLRAADVASKLPLLGAALRTAHAIESNAGAGTGPVRGGLSSRRKKVVLGGSAEASSAEDARKLLQKSKPKAHSRGGVGSKKQLRFAIRDARREQSELKRGVQWKDLVTKAQVRRGLVADQGAAPWPGREGASVKAPIKATVGQSIVEGPKGLSQTLGVAEEKKERGAVTRRAAVVRGRVWAEVAKAAVVVKDQKKKVEEEADGQLQAAVALSEAALGVDYARNFSRGSADQGCVVAVPFFFSRTSLHDLCDESPGAGRGPARPRAKTRRLN